MTPDFFMPTSTTHNAVRAGHPPGRNMQLSLHIAANEHCCLEFGDHDSKLWEEISRHLEAVMGFGRVSDAVAELD